MAATERGGKNRGKQKNDTETLILGRMPPQNIEAEMAVLGAMLLDKDAIEVAENMLHPEDFYREQDAIIYQAVLNLSRAGKSADILTVTEELRRMGRLDDVGGIMYVNELPEHVITTKGIERHVDIVSGKAKLRRLIDTAGDIAEAAYTEENRLDRETLQINLMHRESFVLQWRATSFGTALSRWITKRASAQILFYQSFITSSMRLFLYTFL